MSNKNSPMCDVTGKRTKHGHEDPAPQNNSLLWKFGSWAIIIIIVIVIATLIFLFFKSKPVQPIQPIYSKFGKLIVEEIRLGEGKFGDVRSGTLNDTKAAIKLLKGIPSESQMKAFFLECDIMQDLDHKNIIQCRGCSTGEFLIILEYASKGALGSFLRSKKPQSTQMELMAYATQVANGLAYLHAKHIVHRDLAARNILVFDKNLIKIADFGLARRLSKEYYVPSGREYFPVNWTAPEAIKHNCFSKKTDIWSYGVLLWEIFKHGSEPYRIECHKLKAGERLVQPPGCSSFMYNIMLSCWCYNPDNRPEITEIVDILSR